MEKKIVEIEKITIQKELLVLTEKCRSNENAERTENQVESSLLSEQSSMKKSTHLRNENNENMDVESHETRSRSRSRTNLLNKKDE